MVPENIAGCRERKRRGRQSPAGGAGCEKAGRRLLLGVPGKAAGFWV